MKEAIILILSLSTAILSYLLVEEKTHTCMEEREAIEAHRIDYHLKYDDLEDSVLYVNGGYYDRIDYGIIIQNPPTGVYELGNIDSRLPKTKIFEITKEDNVKMIDFNNTY